MARKNCWEVMNCGREPGGKNAVELGICPAAKEAKADSIHGGKNGGRCCWAIAGTFCGGEVQGEFAKKLKKCTECEFFKLVTREEDNFIPSSEIIKKVKEK